MKVRTASLLVHVAVTLALLLGGVLAPAARAHSQEEPALAKTELSAPVQAAAARDATVAEDLPPLQLTVTDDSSLHVPFKLDLDLMMGPWNDTTTHRAKRPASWGSGWLPLGLPAAGPVAGVAAGSDSFMAVWRGQVSSHVHSFVWWPKSGTAGEHKNLQLEAHGAPALVTLTPERIVGHSDIAPARKEDPGLLFAWERLRDALGAKVKDNA